MKLTISQAAERLGYSRQYVTRIVRDKKIKRTRLAGNYHLVELKDILKHIKPKADK